MGELLFIALLGWAVSAIARSAKKTRQTVGRQAPAPAGEYEGRPMRPADVDLPGQTTMPIHWEGMEEATPAKIMQPETEWVDHYSEEKRAERMSKGNETSPKSTGAVAIPGLDLNLNGDALVKGVIFSEILTRPSARRRR